MGAGPLAQHPGDTMAFARQLFDVVYRSKGGEWSRIDRAGGFRGNETARSRRLASGVIKRRSCRRSVRNLTNVVEQQALHLKALEKRYTLTQTALSDVASGVANASAAIQSTGRLVRLSEINRKHFVQIC